MTYSNKPQFTERITLRQDEIDFLLKLLDEQIFPTEEGQDYLAALKSKLLANRQK
jgi:hypothetical protein